MRTYIKIIIKLSLKPIHFSSPCPALGPPEPVEQCELEEQRWTPLEAAEASKGAALRVTCRPGYSGGLTQTYEAQVGTEQWAGLGRGAMS